MISTRNRFKTGSIWTPKQDGSAVFYAPLWHPTLAGSPFQSKDKTGHICTVTGATWGGQGRTFDGTNDLIDCGNPTTVNFGTGNFTIGAWAKVTDITGTRTFINKGIFSGVEAGYWLFQTSDSIVHFYLTDGSVDVEVVSPSAVGINAIHHFMGVRTGTTTALYVDGVQVGTDTQVGFSNTDVALNLYIGARNGILSFMKGNIGEVQFYNRALTPTEVLQCYQSTKWRYS
jgi:hypothetical protein